MTKRKRGPGRIALFVSLAVTLAFFAAAVGHVEHLTAAKAAKRLFWPMLRLIGVIGLGLAVGQAIEASGWTRTLGVVAAPMFRFAKLGNRCSAAFTTAFFSGAAANAMLLEFFEEGKISRKQLFLTNFVNQLPAFFLHLPTTVFIVLPLTGWAGALYFTLTFLAAMLRTAWFLVYGHLRPEGFIRDDTEEEAAVKRSKKGKGILAGIREKLPRRLYSVAIWVVPVYTAVFTVNAMGLFDALKDAMAGAAVSAFIPMESLSVIVLSFAAEFTSGFAAAGALMDAGVLSVKQTVLALLLGNIIAFPVRALRHQLPRYIGIFEPKTGTQLLLMGQGFRMLSLLIVGVVYYILA